MCRSIQFIFTTLTIWHTVRSTKAKATFPLCYALTFYMAPLSVFQYKAAMHSMATALVGHAFDGSIDSMAAVYRNTLRGAS